MLNQNTSESWDPTWEKIFREEEWGKYPPEHIIRFVARRFYQAKDRQGIRILDLGCGPGACSWYIAREGFALSAIDGSETAIQRCKERLKKESLSGELKVGDLGKLDWPDNHFDAVIDNAAIYSNPFIACKKIVKEVIRVLKPNGHFSSASFTDNTWGYGKGIFGNAKNEYLQVFDGPLQNRGFVLFFDDTQIKELLSPFKQISIDKLKLSVSNGKHNIEWWIAECVK
jgi:2-polyprenyl-3-methyl-5-hydroxy-6-metoxy-1,4-benzoquinol methylase